MPLSVGFNLGEILIQAISKLHLRLNLCLKLVSATAVVAQHLRNAGFDVVVEVISLSAKTAEEADEGVKDNLASPSALLIGAGIGAICFLFVALCGCCFYRYHGRSGNKGGMQNEVPNPEIAPPKMHNEEAELV